MTRLMSWLIDGGGGNSPYGLRIMTEVENEEKEPVDTEVTVQNIRDKEHQITSVSESVHV